MALYVGGTGDTNKFDDYEEGTHTMTQLGSGGGVPLSNAVIRYTKIGNICQVSGMWDVGSASGSSSVEISLPFTSKSPPSCGDVSATTSVIPPRPDDNVASVIFFNPLALASCRSNVSLEVSRDVSADCPLITFAFNIAVSTALLAIVTAPVFDIVTSPETATGLKLVPSATMM